METPTKQIILANYGKAKLARYLVRSYDDLVDVCQTVARQVLKCVEKKQVFDLFNLIECTCTSVPNTLSSVIMGFAVPEKILSRHNYRSRSGRDPQLRVPATQAPSYKCSDSQTTFSIDVTCFFDLYLLHRFIREAMNLAGEGKKLITSKRMAQFTVSNTEAEATGYKLTIVFPCKCDMESLIQLETQFLRQALTDA